MTESDIIELDSRVLEVTLVRGPNTSVVTIKVLSGDDLLPEECERLLADMEESGRKIIRSWGK